MLVIYSIRTDKYFFFFLNIDFIRFFPLFFFFGHAYLAYYLIKKHEIFLKEVSGEGVSYRDMITPGLIPCRPRAGWFCLR